MSKKVEDYIETIPDFPKPGILFRDVTTVLENPEGFKLAIDELDALLDGVDFDVVAGTEARGFVFGAPIAYKRGVGFVDDQFFDIHSDPPFLFLYYTAFSAKFVKIIINNR